VGYEKRYETVQGSWFNSGFHGHYRSLPRNYYNTFREISKPAPPRRFSARIQEGAHSHPFTKHDNKKKFTNDVDQIAASGLKKDPNRQAGGKLTAQLIKWDKKHDAKRYVSCYRSDSRSAPLDLNIKDCMREWAPMGNQMEFNTVYREHYCREPTRRTEIRAMSSTVRPSQEVTEVTRSTMSRSRKRPNTTNAVTRDMQQQLRPEWMGSNMIKQRNESDFSLANEYHGYSQWGDKPACEDV